MSGDLNNHENKNSNECKCSCQYLTDLIEVGEELSNDVKSLVKKEPVMSTLFVLGSVLLVGLLIGKKKR